MKKATLLLAALAFALVMAMGVAPAWAYFTDTTMASGALDIEAGPTTTHFHEWYGTKTKHLQVENAEDAAAPVFVRAKAFGPESSDLELKWDIKGEGWTAADDGWYVYGTAVDPGKSTNELTVSLVFPKVKSETQPSGSVYGDNYNVIVVYESTPARYDDAGNPDPDWGDTLDSETEENNERGE